MNFCPWQGQSLCVIYVNFAHDRSHVVRVIPSIGWTGLCILPTEGAIELCTSFFFSVFLFFFVFLD